MSKEMLEKRLMIHNSAQRGLYILRNALSEMGYTGLHAGSSISLLDQLDENLQSDRKFTHKLLEG